MNAYAVPSYFLEVPKQSLLVKSTKLTYLLTVLGKNNA